MLGSLVGAENPSSEQSTPAPSEERPRPAANIYLEFFPISPASEGATRAQLAAYLDRTQRSRHFTIHYRANTFTADDMTVFTADAEAAIDHIERLMQLDWQGQADYYLAYALFPPPDSGLRGYTRSIERMIFVLHDGTGTRLDRQYISAHEITHQIARDTIGGASSTMLSEGLAMYTAQTYLLKNGNVSLDGFAKAALEQGRLVPLTRLSDGSTGYRGRLFDRYPYDEAGSFVQFLIRTYGVEAFKRVYTTGDYAGVYGKNLSTLEDKWRTYLQTDRAIGRFAPSPASYLQAIGDVQDAYGRLFAALAAGERVETRVYEALDAARIAADRGDYETATARLQEADI